jgi:hypothetical protein
MKQPLAIIAAGALIAGAILFIFRWEMAAFGGQTYRLDRWTGEIFACNAPNQTRASGMTIGMGHPFRCTLPTAEEFLGTKK